MRRGALRVRLVDLLGVGAFVLVGILVGLLAWRLTPPEGPPLKRPSRGPARDQIPDDASLVLISIEGLRADRLGSYGEAPLSPTPHIDRIAREGYRFEQALTPVPSAFPAHVAILTGTSPVAHESLAARLGSLPPGRATLAEVLRSSGFRTAGFVGGAAVGRSSGLARGFERFDAPRAGDRPAAVRDLAARSAEQVVDAARDWLNENFRARFFLWVELADPAPPHPPVSDRLLRRRSPYDAEVEATDAQVGRLLARLGSLGVLGHTVVILTGAYGEGLGEHGESGAGFGLYDSTLRVPLLLKLPGDAARDRSIPEAVRLTDVMPTVLDLLRLASPEPLDGRSLVPLLDPGRELTPLPLLAQSTEGRDLFGAPERRAFRLGGFKLVTGGRDELYDLRRDPGETRDLAPNQPLQVAEMRRRLEAAWPAAPTTGSGSAAAPPSGPAAAGAPVDGQALAGEALVALASSDGARARRALEDLRRLLEAARGGDGAPPALLALQGAALRLQGRLAEALAADEEALRRAGDATDAGGPRGAPDDLAPLRGILLSDIGACRRLMGQAPGALAAYRRAVALRPDDLDDRLALADLLVETGSADEAVDELRSALARAPGDAEALAGLGGAFLATQQPAAALLPLQDALRLSPTMARPWLDLGRAYEALGHPGDAGNAYEEALARAPDPSDPVHRESSERLRLLPRRD